MSASIKVYDWAGEKSPEELQTTRQTNVSGSQPGKVALKEVSSMALPILLLLLLTRYNGYTAMCIVRWHR